MSSSMCFLPTQQAAEEHENKDKSKHSHHSNHHHHHHREKQVSPKAVPSPTLAELNAVTDGPRTKRATYMSPYSPSPPPPPISASYHHYSTAISDSSMNLHPRMGFAERGDGVDDLSSSFRSLYKSIFGHSIQTGEYFNDIGHRVAPEGSSSSTSDLGLSNSSLPLGASATALFSSVSLRNPQFTSLMDSFRDIAESNSWDKLDPSQIQGLMDSFKVGDHDKFGLEPEAYAELHTSFNHFLSQLNNRFLTGSSGSSPQLSEYSRYHNHGSGSIISHGGMGGVDGRGLPPKYHSHHQLDMMSPLVSSQQASPPSGGFCGPPQNRTPSPHTSPTQAINPPPPPPLINQQFGGYVSTSHTSPSLSSVAQPTGPEGMPIRSAATELFDDDDDFDWSKLM